MAKRRRVSEHLRKLVDQASVVVLRFGAIPLGVATFWTINDRGPIWFADVKANADALSLGSFIVALLAALMVAGWWNAATAWIRAAQLRAGKGTGIPVHEVFDRCSNTLQIELDRQGREGWTHHVKASPNSPIPVTALATSYGLKLSRLLGSPLTVETEERVANSVCTALRQPSEKLWHAHTQGHESVEVSATVVSAIAPIVGLQRTRSEVQEITRSLDLLRDEYGRTPIYALTSLAAGILQVAPSHDSLPGLIDQLVEAALDHSGEIFWSTVGDGASHDLRPSIAHTARAVTVLTRAAGPLSLKGKAMRVRDGGLDYLSQFQPGGHDDKFEETIQRRYLDHPDVLGVRHFTPALVLRALAESRAHVDRYDDLGRGVMRYYKDGAFWWDQHLAPIWMMYQACKALQTATLVRSRY